MMERTTASPYINRKTRRRDYREPVRRPFADEAPLKTTDKHVVKNPTRYVPESAGFEILSKQEISKDKRDIEKNNSMAALLEPDDELEDGLFMNSTKPPCPPDSTIIKKRKRYVSWVNNPDLITRDISAYKSTIELVKSEIAKMEEYDDRWLDAYQLSRAHFLNQLQLLREERKQLTKTAHLLYNVCVEESGNQSRKKRTMNMRDVLSQLLEREQELNAQLTQCETEVAAQQPNGGPPLEISISPLKLAQDLLLKYPKNSAVITPYGKGIVKRAALTRVGDVECTQVHVRLSYGLAMLQEAQVTVCDSLPSQPPAARNNTVNWEEDLNARYTSLDEKIKMCQNTMYDLEPLLLDEDDDEDSKAKTTYVDMTRERERADALPYMLNPIDFDEAYWVSQLEERADTHTAPNRRKRRAGLGGIPAGSILYSSSAPRTPHSLPLLLSPLSVYVDKYLGTQYGDAPSHTSLDMQLPAQLGCAEDTFLENAQLKSNVVRSNILLRRLQLAKEDWARQLEESQRTLQRAQAQFESMKVDNKNLYMQHKQDISELIKSGDNNKGDLEKHSQQQSGALKEAGKKNLGRTKSTAHTAVVGRNKRTWKAKGPGGTIIADAGGFEYVAAEESPVPAQPYTDLAAQSCDAIETGVEHQALPSVSASVPEPLTLSQSSTETMAAGAMAALSGIGEEYEYDGVGKKNPNGKKNKRNAKKMQRRY